MALAQRRRRYVDDDEPWDDNLYEAKYYPKRVFKDGKGPHVTLMLTDSAPARSRRPTLLDGYRLSDSQALLHRPHQVSMNDAGVRTARVEAESARDEMIARLNDAWRHPLADRLVGGGLPRDRDDEDGDDDPDRAYEERNAYLQNAYKTGAPGVGFPAPYHGPDPYALSVWSQQAAIRNGDPESVDAMQRRMQAFQPNATAESVRGERYRPRDAMTDAAAARSDKEAAYSEMLHRLENAWRS
jgi:hypothetical protein